MAFTTTIRRQGPSPDNYGLDAVAAHNRANANAFGVYNGYAQAYHEDAPYLDNPPTPRSNTASDGIRTRSGRSTRRNDSPFSIGKSRISKSPAAKSKKDKKSRLDKSKTPKLTQPLSILTKDMTTPMKDMDAWVNRSSETRRQEVEKRNGYVTRPMNSFMLYRSAFADRTKAWCTQNNHQVVSSLSGQSWPLEPQSVRDQFNEWAKTERDNHQAAHPDYKFSPSKPASKRRKGFESDDEGDLSSVDGDLDGEYRARGRNVRQGRHAPAMEQTYHLNHTVGFDSHPYFNQQGNSYEQSPYQYGIPSRPMPSNAPVHVGYDAQGNAYDTHTGQYIQQHSRQSYAQEVHDSRVLTPQSIAQQSVGGYGLPGGQHSGIDDLFTSSRTSTPMQQFAQYGQQPVYPQYAMAYPSQHSYQPVDEHQHWLQAQSLPQVAIDPSLEAELSEYASLHRQHESHFESALGDLGAGEMPVYFDESTSPNGALAPAWSPTADLR